MGSDIEDLSWIREDKDMAIVSGVMWPESGTFCHWQTKVVSVLPRMGWASKGRSIKERIGKDQRHLKGTDPSTPSITAAILELEGCHKQHERCYGDGEG